MAEWPCTIIRVDSAWTPNDGYVDVICDKDISSKYERSKDSHV